jgi:hypothetical protein
MAGVEERYKIKGTTVLGWLNNYRKSQIQSAIDIVNGMYILYNNRHMYAYCILLMNNLNTSNLDLFVAGDDTPVKSKAKSLKRNAADNDILLYPVKVEKIDIN